VVLEHEDGRTKSVPLERLSAEDREYVVDWMLQHGK
jgi:hypothetical protein